MSNIEDIGEFWDIVIFIIIIGGSRCGIRVQQKFRRRSPPVAGSVLVHVASPERPFSNPSRFLHGRLIESSARAPVTANAHAAAASHASFASPTPCPPARDRRRPRRAPSRPSLFPANPRARTHCTHAARGGGVSVLLRGCHGMNTPFVLRGVFTGKRRHRDASVENALVTFSSVAKSPGICTHRNEFARMHPL